MKIRNLLLLAVVGMMMSGCLLTKVVSVPMRVVGAAVSIIPVAGDAAHGAIDKAADVVDKLPF